jgi:hypothetical protein
LASPSTASSSVCCAGKLLPLFDVACTASLGQRVPPPHALRLLRRAGTGCLVGAPRRQLATWVPPGLRTMGCELLFVALLVSKLVGVTPTPPQDSHGLANHWAKYKKHPPTKDSPPLLDDDLDESVPTLRPTTAAWGRMVSSTAHCRNGILDGDEVDVDCGGADCNSCAIGKLCILDSDCLSGKCSEEEDTCERLVPIRAPTAYEVANVTNASSSPTTNIQHKSAVSFATLQQRLNTPHKPPTSKVMSGKTASMRSKKGVAREEKRPAATKPVYENPYCIHAIKKSCPNLYEMECMKCVFFNMADLSVKGGCGAEDQKMVTDFCHRPKSDDGAGDDEDDDTAPKRPPGRQPTAHPTTWLEASFQPRQTWEFDHPSALPTRTPTPVPSIITATPTTSPTATPTSAPTTAPSYSAYALALRARFAKASGKEEIIHVHYHGHQHIVAQPKPEHPVAKAHHAAPLTPRAPKLERSPDEEPSDEPPVSVMKQSPPTVPTPAAPTPHPTLDTADSCDQLHQKIERDCAPLQYKGAWCTKLCTKKITRDPRNAPLLSQCPTQWR